MKINDNQYVKKILDKYNIDITIKEIEQRYSEKHRHYHTIYHINNLIHQINTKFTNKEITKPQKEILIISTIFHDIIYNIDKNNNEELCVKLLQMRSPHNDNIKIISNIILDTINHVPSNKLSKIFCNLDMYIISNSDINELIKYEKLIRLEYIKYDYSIYKKHRILFLKNILKSYGKTNKKNILKLINHVNMDDSTNPNQK